MIISARKKFIFVANTKTASNSIESILSDDGDINIFRPLLGKHDTLLLIKENFNSFFLRGSNIGLSFNDYYKFGVMREPFSWIVSWYNYNAREELASPNSSNHAAYSANRSFGQYFEDHVLNGGRAPFTGCQRDKFVDYKNNDELIADEVILYENLQADFKKTCKKLKLNQVEISKVRRNVTAAKKLTVEDLSINDRNMVEHYYSRDIEFYKDLVKLRKRWNFFYG